MAFTREYIRNLAKESGVELPKELEDGLITEHIAARDAYAEAHKPEEKPVTDSEEYKQLKTEFEQYKQDAEAAKTRGAKEKAFADMLSEIGIPENRRAKIAKVSGEFIDGLEIGEDGKVKDSEKKSSALREEWADFVTTKSKTGAKIDNPPTTTGGATMTREEIVKIKDPVERRAAIAQNLELFETTKENE